MQARRMIAAFATAGVLLASCGALPPGILSRLGTRQSPLPTNSPSPQFPVTFLVHAPAETASGAEVDLDVLDEVTGLSLNSQAFPMQSLGGTTWQVTVGLPRGDLLFYRYSLQTPSEIPEANTAGGPLDYRVYFVGGPARVEDQVSGWVGGPLPGTSGVIHGLVRDAATGSGVPGVIVTVAGLRTYTDGSGSYSFQGVPAGKHMLVAFDPDGAYRPYEQEAVVANGEQTPTMMALVPLPRVSITFHVFPPAGTPNRAPVRLVGNLLALGNTFEPGPAGSMVEATRAPVLTTLPDGSCVGVFSLPVGFHLRYKITLGDGFWNAEHSSSGLMLIRELDVPDRDTLINLEVASWGSSSGEGITFNVSTPAELPMADWIALQLSPFSGIWMNPLPMWRSGANQWTFVLLSPLGWPENISYRYCRNGDCGVADEADQAGTHPRGRQLAPVPLTQNLHDTVSSWVGWGRPEVAPLAAPMVSARPDFQTGVVFSPGNWAPPYGPTLSDLAGLHSQWLVLSPTWYLGSANPLPEIDYLPQDGSSLRQELLSQIAAARAAGLEVGLAPTLLPASGSAEVWWASAERGADWWDSWFSAYRNLLLFNADIARQAGVQELVIARAEILPAFPGVAGAPSDADARWRALIGDIRARYPGRIGVELLLTDHLQPIPTFLDDVDDVYVQVRSPLAPSDEASLAEMTSGAGSVLDNDLPGLRAMGKPLFLEAAFASADGGASGCPLDRVGTCQGLEALPPGSLLALSTPVNLEVQSRAEQALLVSAAGRSWIGGFLTWDYYPAAGLQDASASVHGKPAEAVLSASFQALR